MGVSAVAIAEPASTQPIRFGDRVKSSVPFFACSLLAAIVVISRRHDAFTNPQFFAEDGAKWFSDAYNHGPINALFISYEGYFQVLARLGALIEAPFGVRAAPFIYNLLGLLIQVAPVLFFLSKRFEPILPSFWIRGAVALVYLLMPSTELNVSLTNSHFHLGILVILILVAPLPTSKSARAFDVTAVLLLAFTGPLVYVLFPLSLLWFFVQKHRWTLVLVAMLGVGLIAQIYAATLSVRNHSGLGASLHGLILLLVNRVILAGSFAEEGTTHVFLANFPHETVIGAVILAAAFALVVFAAIKGPWALRMLGLASMGMLAAGLLEPLVSATGNQWQIMLAGQAGERYFFLAQITWVLIVIWAVSRIPVPAVKFASLAAVVLAAASGLAANWTYPRFVDYHWPTEAKTITTAGPGTREVLPIPPGPPWFVDLVAK
jgi:hypothetical protein